MPEIPLTMSSGLVRSSLSAVVEEEELQLNTPRVKELGSRILKNITEGETADEPF